MKVVLWLRGVLNGELHNWNVRCLTLGCFDLVAYRTADTEKLEVGTMLEIISVNRSTGKIAVKYAD